VSLEEKEMSMQTEMAPLQVAGRLDRLRERLGEHGVDALIVTNLANVRYLSGFTGSAGVVLVTENGALLTTDGRYRTQSAEQVEGAGLADRLDIAIGNGEGQRDALRAAVVAVGATRVGLEAEHVSWAASRRWRDLLEGAADGVPVTGAVEALREVKDSGELYRMARAAAIADGALAEVLPMLADAANAPVSEAEFALALDTAMRRGGAEDRAFDTIIAVGPNSAKPHHRPTSTAITPGHAMVVDFGAIFEGYRSDMTRTFWIGGEPTGEMARVFDVVRASQAAGVAAVRSGIGARDVDSVCRDVITAAGWADRFEHGTGHGVGLDIHEAPTVSQQGTAILAPGVVVTVEPGVYLPGLGGVRIEDTLVVTEDGSRTLTGFSKDVAA
jgi:Xaa-Pro aminopeptidase